MDLFDGGSKGNILSKLQRAGGELFAGDGTEPKNDEINRKTKFCSNCGEKLNPGAKFCQGCGTPVGAEASVSTVPPIPVSNPSNQETRQQEFAGNVLKCPNCGNVISHTTAICPGCGHHITGQEAVGSVQAFSDELMRLEAKREGSGLGSFIFGAFYFDEQKLSLIRTFPIPNTIDDIQEFMLLAIASIDVKLSKNTLGNRLDNTTSKEISDAWVAKMKQAYQKAKASFPNDPAFDYIQQLYVDKMTELKMKFD